MPSFPFASVTYCSSMGAYLLPESNHQTTDEVCAPYSAELAACASLNLGVAAVEECAICIGARYSSSWEGCAQLRVIQCTALNDCTVCHPCYSILEEYWDCFWQVKENCSTNCQGLFPAPPSPAPNERDCLGEISSTYECFLDSSLESYVACNECLDDWTGNQFNDCNQYLDRFCYALHDKCLALCEPCELRLETLYECVAKNSTLDTTCWAPCPDASGNSSVNPTTSVNPTSAADNAGAPSASPVVPTTINPIGRVTTSPSGAMLTPPIVPTTISTSAARGMGRFVFGNLFFVMV